MSVRSGRRPTRGRIVRVALVAGALLLIVAAAAGAVVGYKAHQVRQMLAEARSLAGVGEWQKAKNLFGFYLIKHPDDATAMREYAEASLRIVENRRATVRDAAGAYYQLAVAQPDQPEQARQLLQLLEENGYWSDLDYYASALLRLNAGNETAKFHRALALERLGRLDDALAAYEALVNAGTRLPAAYGNMALVLERQGDAGAADAVLNRAAAAGLDDGAAELERARLQIARGNVDEAHEWLARAESAMGSTAPVCRAGAELCLARTDWTCAVDRLQRCLKHEPARPENYLMLVLALQRQAKPDAALEVLEGMDERVRASSPELMATLCEMYVDHERLDEARAAAEAYTASYPDHVLIHQYLEARMMLSGGDTAGAVERLTAVSRGNPQLAAARYYLALAHLREADHEKARQVLESFLRDFPEDANGLALRDKLYGAQAAPAAGAESAEDALARLREQYQAAPGVETLRQWVSALAAAGQRDSAGQAIEDAAAGPLNDSADVWAMLADFYLDQGGANRLAKASSAVTRALLFEPEHAGAMRSAVRLFMREGDYDGALEMCARYLAVQPNDGGVLAQEASLLLRRGDTAQALNAIDRGLEIADTPAARFVRATALLALGRHQDALADLQRTSGAVDIDAADHNAAMAEAYLGVGERELAQRYLQSAKVSFAASGRALPAGLVRVDEALARSAP